MKPFKLKGTVGPHNDVDPRDARKINHALIDLGLLEQSELNTTDLIGRATLASLKAFQRRNGLTADGVVRPDGPSERLISTALVERKGRNSGTALELSDSVGAVGANRPHDVRNLRRVLALAGYFPAQKAQEPASRIDEELELAVRAFQHDLDLKQDGIVHPGGQTAQALSRLAKATTPSGLNLAQASPKKLAQTWDKITDQRISRLHPKVQGPATAFINDVEAQLGIELRVTASSRTIAEQDALFAQGRTAPGKVVTRAKGGESYHNFGLAFDVVEIRSGNANWNTNWSAIGNIGKSHGFQWGGDWQNTDRPHFEMNFGLSTQQLRQGAKP